MRVTKFGVAILVVLAVAVVLSIWGSGPLKGGAIVAIAVIVLLLAGEGLTGWGERVSDAARKEEVLRGQAKRRRFDDGP